MKGIVLAGGTGSRLWPITRGISKQLLPIYDKPLIHYPISTLFMAGIREILIITTPDDQQIFQRLLGDGAQYGVSFSYSIQSQPRGIAESFIVGSRFIDSSEVALILGDNIFYGSSLGTQLSKIEAKKGATIFAHRVFDAHRYGVVELDPSGKTLSIEEKPVNPRSNYAIPGLYFYDSTVCEKAERVIPSHRGELEITSINNMYLTEDSLTTIVMPRGTTWFDAGTFESLHSASSFIQIIEQRDGLKISCLEEVAWRNGWISNSEVENLANDYGSNPFREYLLDLINRVD